MHRGLQEVLDARVIYLDMNSFFASVEQQHQPYFRNRPLAVVSHNVPRGTVLAASYEAKHFGIKTGTRLEAARLLCPSLQVCEPNGTRYKAAHHAFMKILTDLFGSEVQARSIDEAVIYLAPNWYDSERAQQMARTIKQRFKHQLGEHIRCSIGIAPNSFLGKVATDLQKPDGLVEIKLAELTTILGSLELIQLPGIAAGNISRLAYHTIYSPLQLYYADPQLLYQQFGIWGQYWWWRLHGYEVDYQFSPPKSMSHQHVLKHWLKSYQEAWPIIMRMGDRLIHRLRHNHFQCQKVSLYLSLSNAPSLCAERQFTVPTSQYTFLLETLALLLHSFPLPLLGPIRKISVGFFLLTEEGSGLQLDLFNQVAPKESLSKAVESIRSRFGINAIQIGQAMTLEPKVAQEQIGFGRIKDRGP